MRLNNKNLVEISEIRTYYEQASENVEMRNILDHFLNNEADLKNDLLLAYKAAMQGIKANHSRSPFDKLNYLKKALYDFKKAVQINPENIEIRFLRFTIEHNIPSILGMDGDIESDKKKIIAGIENANLEEALKKKIIKYLIKSGRCSKKEIEILNAKLL